MAIFRKFGNSSRMMVPNYTPLEWGYECDVMRITRAGVMCEYEVKMSVSDFNADARKGPDAHTLARYRFEAEREAQGATVRFKLPERDLRTKHERLAAGDPVGPARFWFVIPQAMADSSIVVPDWAGLMVYGRGHPRVVKQAPQLHRGKVSDAVAEHARGVFYWRYWNLKAKLPDATVDPDT